MNGRWLIHIGYPKAGSSTLQEGVLSRHEGINYLSGPTLAARAGPEAAEAFGFYKAMTGEIPRDLEATRRIWARHYAGRADPERLNVVSAERFVQNRRPVADVAVDLFAVVGPAHVLMVVRRQADLLRSLYDMSPFDETDLRRAYLPFPSWLTAMLSDAPDTFASRLKYADVARTYAAVFGPERVHVVSFARLFHDAAATAQFCAAVGLDFPALRDRLAATHVGHAADHGYRKLTRRFGAVARVRATLPAPVLRLARAALRRTVPAGRTAVAPADEARIAEFYAGHAPAELAALRLGSVVV